MFYPIGKVFELPNQVQDIAASFTEATLYSVTKDGVYRHPIDSPHQFTEFVKTTQAMAVATDPTGAVFILQPYVAPAVRAFRSNGEEKTLDGSYVSKHYRQFATGQSGYLDCHETYHCNISGQRKQYKIVGGFPYHNARTVHCLPDDEILVFFDVCKDGRPRLYRSRGNTLRCIWKQHPMEPRLISYCPFNQTVYGLVRCNRYKYRYQFCVYRQEVPSLFIQAALMLHKTIQISSLPLHLQDMILDHRSERYLYIKGRLEKYGSLTDEEEEELKSCSCSCAVEDVPMCFYCPAHEAHVNIRVWSPKWR